MSVTLEVSKLSGWLKADAYCRVQRGIRQRGKRVARRGDGAGGEGRSKAAHAAWHACVWPSSGVPGQKAQAEAHLEHVAHVCDAGGVKAQRLVESIRTLPRVQKGATDRGTTRVARRCGTQREGRISSARGVRVCGPAREWGQKAQAEAHSEHCVHVCDAGGVKAQRLVESIRLLPRVQRGHIRQRDDACGTERCGTKERANQQRTRRARVWPSSGVGRGAEGAGGSAQRTCPPCL
jgi:hypothetical protein